MNDMTLSTEQALPVEHLPTQRMTAADMHAQVQLVQQVMRAVMLPDVHFGVIPGTNKPSLYKAGSEVLLATFRIGVHPEVQDLSTPTERRYLVRAKAVHIPTGTVIGVGVGECSSEEERYKWKACGDKEYEATPEDSRRIKHYKRYTAKQVKQSIADVSNTVLKMAKKRAQIDMTLTALAVSDIFTQDLEDTFDPAEQAGDDERGPRDESLNTDSGGKEKASCDPKYFAEMLPKWQQHAERKGGAFVLQFLEQKFQFTAQQKAAITSIEKKS